MIVKYPDRKLRRISKPLFPDFSTKEVAEICTEMREECWKVGGFAISAIQIDRPYRVLGYFSQKNKEYNWIVDPKIISSGGTSVMQEGCLSIPGYFWNIERPAKVCISYKDINAKDHVRTFTGVVARAILHEMDHFDGVLIPDFMMKDELEEFEKHYEQYSHTEEYKAPFLISF